MSSLSDKDCQHDDCRARRGIWTEDMAHRAVFGDPAPCPEHGIHVRARQMLMADQVRSALWFAEGWLHTEFPEASRHIKENIEDMVDFYMESC